MPNEPDFDPEKVHRFGVEASGNFSDDPDFVHADDYEKLLNLYRTLKDKKCQMTAS